MTITQSEVAETLQDLYPRAHNLTRNKADAEDLLQNTFIQASRYLHTFKTGSVRAWLNTMMYRLYLNSIRGPGTTSRKAAYTARTISIESLPNFEVPVSPTAEAEWDLDRALKTIGTLPELQRTAFGFILNESSYEEASKAWNVPRNTTKSRISRARCLLKEALNVVN